jgi:pyruvate/2-oxoglutarate dehydrogenase complex dihydrolipoamide acyltransferase (E2) component
MPTPIPTPRVNNNDDFVRFSKTYVEAGALVHKGQIVADIETDKASVTVEADREGYLLAFVPPLGDMIAVGSTLAWLGATPDEPVPADIPDVAVAGAGGAFGEPTLKASLLLARLGLRAEDIPASGPRLTADDVLRHAQHHRTGGAATLPARATGDTPPELPTGRRVPLDVAERGMLRTVSWHHDTPVVGYVEIAFETAPWDAFAAGFQAEHQLLMSPLLPLMAYRLVDLARENPKINSTIVDDARHEYAGVNLGFTFQSGSRLLLLTVRNAGSMSGRAFVDELNGLMRRGLKGKLTSEDTSDVTIGFSSMARWQVTRHVPVLPPYTALIVAHTHGRDGVAALGASYDHRVLTGGEVAAILNRLARPTDEAETTDEP